MSNQERSEQPVAVCPDCGGTKEKPSKTTIFGTLKMKPEQITCDNLFHSSAEQGSQPNYGHTEETAPCHVPSVNAPLTAKWDKQPTAQTVAGEPKRCKTCVSRLCEDCESGDQCCGCEDMKVITDLRRQLAERDAVIEKIREIVKRNKGMMAESVHGRLLETVTASPSTILESVRQEELYMIQDTRSYLGSDVFWWRPDGHGYTTNVDEAWKVSKEQAESICRCRDTDKMWPADEILKRSRRAFDMQLFREIPIAAAIRQNPEAEKEKKA